MSLSLENAGAAQRDFDMLQADAFIEQIRTPVDAGPADVDAIIAQLHGTVHYAPIPTSGMLGRVEPLSIWVNRTDDPCRQEITKGHELGHFFLLTVATQREIYATWGEPARHFPYGDSRQSAVEAFCDYFAHRLIGIPPCLAVTS